MACRRRVPALRPAFLRRLRASYLAWLLASDSARWQDNVFEAGAAARKAMGGTIRLQAWTDRVRRDRAAGALLMDYKTSSSRPRGPAEAAPRGHASSPSMRCSRAGHAAGGVSERVDGPGRSSPLVRPRTWRRQRRCAAGMAVDELGASARLRAMARALPALGAVRGLCRKKDFWS